jgi:hypothetical protein
MWRGAAKATWRASLKAEGHPEELDKSLWPFPVHWTDGGWDGEREACPVPSWWWLPHTQHRETPTNTTLDLCSPLTCHSQAPTVHEPEQGWNRN